MTNPREFWIAEHIAGDEYTIEASNKPYGIFGQQEVITHVIECSAYTEVVAKCIKVCDERDALEEKLRVAVVALSDLIDGAIKAENEYYSAECEIDAGRQALAKIKGGSE